MIYELAKSEQPHLASTCTLFITGGDITEKAEQIIAQCGCPVLRKPFELRDIGNVIAVMAPRTSIGGRSA